MNYVELWEQEHAKRLMREDQPLSPVAEFFGRVIERASKNEGPPFNVLDVGCSAGSNALWLASLGCFRVHAFDGSGSAINRMLDAAISRNLLGRFASVMVSDLSRPWPYQSQTMDVVLDVRAIENLKVDDAAFAFVQAARVLKNGGKFFSITASDERPDHFTTCGVVRKMTDRDVFSVCSAVGLKVETMVRAHVGTLEDWAIEATKQW